MKKNKLRIIAIVLLVIMLFSLSACGKKYKCQWCGKSTSKAYYHPFDSSSYFCEQCAREYFSPFPIEGYRVK